MQATSNRAQSLQQAAELASKKLGAELQEEAALKSRAEQNGKLWADRVEELQKKHDEDSRAFVQKLEHRALQVDTHACTHARTPACMPVRPYLQVEDLERRHRADASAWADKLERESAIAARLRSENKQLAERSLALQQAAELAEKKLGAELQEEAALKSRAEQYGKLWSDRVEELERKYQADAKAWAEKLEQEAAKSSQLRLEHSRLTTEAQVSKSKHAIVASTIRFSHRRQRSGRSRCSRLSTLHRRNLVWNCRCVRTCAQSYAWTGAQTSGTGTFCRHAYGHVCWHV